MPSQQELESIKLQDVGDLEQAHREGMLDLILAWGSLDGALGMMLARALGISLPEAAD